MELNLEKLSNLLDKRPMSVLLALCLSTTMWAIWNWRDEVKDHKADLRKTYEVLQKTAEIQSKFIEQQQKINELKWKVDTIRTQN